MRIVLLASLLVPGLASSAAALGVVAVARLPESAATASLHPALLSPDGASGSALASLINAGARSVSMSLRSAPPVASVSAAGLALRTMAAQGPAHRAAAAVLARALTDGRDAAALIIRMPELAQGDLPALVGRKPDLGAATALAETARRDPSFQFLFDGDAPPRVGVPDGAVLDGEDLITGGERVAPLGRGFFGVVHPHPEVEGAVIKTDLPRAAAPRGEPAGFADIRMARDRETALEAARIGAGPRILGEGRVGGRPALVKERVYGDTVADLLRAGKFTAEDHALVQELFLKIARSGVSFADPRAENIIVGRTLASPARRAYLIDGGGVFVPTRVETPGDHAERLFGVLRELLHPAPLLSVFDAVHFSRPRPD